MATPPVVGDFQVLEQGVSQFDAGAPLLPVEQFGLHRPQNDSITALSLPIDPIEGTRPEARARSVKAQEVNCTIRMMDQSRQIALALALPGHSACFSASRIRHVFIEVAARPPRMRRE